MSKFSEEEIIKDIKETEYNEENVGKLLYELENDTGNYSCYDNAIAIIYYKNLYQKEKEKNKEAYRKANNYLYFNDSADYEVGLWEVIRSLRPDLAEKWDNGEDCHLEYLEEND